ncbi:MAG: hypothetical protein ACXIVE_02195 [Salinarimonas sp.]
MSLDELLRSFTDRTETINELRRQLHALQRQAHGDEIALDRETRDLAIAFFKTVGIELTPRNLVIVLGAMGKMAEWLRDARQQDRLRKSGEALIDQFTAILEAVKTGPDHVDPMIMKDGLLVDPQSSTPVDMLVILQKNPVDAAGIDGTTSDQSVRDRIDAAADRHGLKRYTHISSRNPVCVLVGEVAPNAIASFVDHHVGLMVRNRSGGTFRGPDRITDTTESSPSQPDAQPKPTPSSAPVETRRGDPAPAPTEKDPASVTDGASDTPGNGEPANVDRDAEKGLMPSNGPAPAPQKLEPRRPTLTRDANGNHVPKLPYSTKKEQAAQPIGDENFTPNGDDQDNKGSTT